MIAKVDWPTWLIALAALYGGVLATVTFVRQNRAAKPRLRVRLVEGWDDHPEPLKTLSAYVSNPGQVSIEVEEIHLERADREFLDLRSSAMPDRPVLNPGQACDVTWMAHKVALALIALNQGTAPPQEGLPAIPGPTVVFGVASDRLGNEYRSKGLTVDLAVWYGEDS